MLKPDLAGSAGITGGQGALIYLAFCARKKFRGFFERKFTSFSIEFAHREIGNELPKVLHLKQALVTLIRQYQLETGDLELARQQFREFIDQVPLLYLILSWNAAAVLFTYSQFEVPAAGLLFPIGLSVIATVRGIWWSRRKNLHFADTEILRQIGTTSWLAVFMSTAFTAWGLFLYPYGDDHAQGHLTFFLALAQISAVFCLIPLRSAALSVATVGTTSFFFYFLFADSGQMASEAIMLAFVAGGMIVVLYRYNATFSQLIQSQNSLNQRQAETQKLSDENRQIAFTDPLSGLPNRRALIHRLNEIGAGESRGPDTLAVVFIDLDGFKYINDVHGHEFGDRLITEIGQTLGGLRPFNAMLVRMGGDEFALMIESKGAAGKARVFAEQALDVLTLPLDVSGRQLRIGASIGIAVNDDGATGPFELLRCADMAMYVVKSEGKGGIKVYDPSLDRDRMWRHQIEKEIEGGLDRNEFDVAYQPLVDARNLKTVGVEVLLRWPGRPAGPLSPDEFISIAEGSGLIQTLGMYVLERACREMNDVDRLRLNVNVSPTQFSHPEFERQVREILSRTGFPPDRLQLEITERHLIDYPDRASLAIEALRSLGVGFALDDFGTGFTSLAYLQSYGFSCVKIDRSLTKRLETDSKASYLISGLVQMARGLDVRVVAEGVETEQLCSMLRAAGCNELQGYLFGRPAPLAEIKAAWLRAEPVSESA